MKKKSNLILLIIILITQIYIIFLITYPKEDVNRDGKVNALDLLIVQKKILEESDK